MYLYHRDNNTISTFRTTEYWESINPQLTVSTTVSTNCSNSTKISLSICTGLEKKKNYYNKYGFVGLEPEKSPDYLDLIEKLEQGVENLVSNGWPAIFIYMYNEAYEVIKLWNPILTEVNSGSVFLGDIYAWKTIRIGWGPHRDRMNSDRFSFREDGSAMLSTTWLPLTNVTTKTSCMNFIPAIYDPNYFEEKGDTIMDIFGNLQNFQRIRPMPLDKGNAIHFTHRVIHWGSAVDPEEGEFPNRIAMSWVVGDTRFEEPAINSDKLFRTDGSALDCRLAFISSQIINYAGQTGITKHEKSIYWRMFSQSKSDFTESYIGKVQTLYSVYSFSSKIETLVRKKEKEATCYNLIENMDLGELFC